MKIGIIADTHMSEQGKDLPQAVLEAFRQVDMVIHAGDLVESSVLSALKAVCGNIKAVCGNMDSAELKKDLSVKEILQVGKYRIGIMHGRGHPRNLLELLAEEFKDDRVDLVIFGHSHTPTNEKIGGVIYFNPGSPTDKVFSPYNSYGIIEIDDKIEAKIIKL